MACQLLRDTDAFSMAHALEVRVPFVDHELVELVVGLPASLKLSPDTPKRLLVRMFANRLPPEIVHRPKQGFVFPFDTWLRTGLADRVRSMVLGCGALDGQESERLLRDFQAGRVHWSRVWALAVLSHWLD
jgi:asparagine synthase (glutamine-hydrolysing)